MVQIETDDITRAKSRSALYIVGVKKGIRPMKINKTSI